MIQVLSQCGTCARYQPGVLTGTERGVCDAFPSGIPAPVFTNLMDHRRQVDGDGGVRWESDGAPFPEWALTTVEADHD